MRTGSKLIWLGLGVSVSLVGLLGGTDSLAASDTTEAIIEFIQSTDPTPPVDPDHPEEGIKDNGNGATDGPLSINYLCNFEFGMGSIQLAETHLTADLADIELSATGEHKKVPNFIQVTDNRGANSGWKVSVRQNTPLTNERGFQLKGAWIDLKNVTLQSMDETEPDVKLDPIRLDGDSQEDVLLVDTGKGKGMGNWLISFGADDASGEESVFLNIPAATKKEPGTYTTTLKWTLEDSL